MWCDDGGEEVGDVRSMDITYIYVKRGAFRILIFVSQFIVVVTQEKTAPEKHTHATL